MSDAAMIPATSGEPPVSRSRRADEQSVYFKEYWRKNRLEILEKRRLKYQQDQEYRRCIRTTAHKRWAEQEPVRVATRKKKVRLTKAELALSYLRHDTRKFMPRVFLLGGVKTKLFPMAELCLKVGARAHAVKRWTYAGALPHPTLVDQHGRFWYSERYLEDLAAVFEACRARSSNVPKLEELLKQELPNADWHGPFNPTGPAYGHNRRGHVDGLDAVREDGLDEGMVREGPASGSDRSEGRIDGERADGGSQHDGGDLGTRTDSGGGGQDQPVDQV